MVFFFKSQIGKKLEKRKKAIEEICENNIELRGVKRVDPVQAYTAHIMHDACVNYYSVGVCVCPGECAVVLIQVNLHKQLQKKKDTGTLHIHKTHIYMHAYTHISTYV